MSERIPESVIEEAVEAGADSIIGCDLKLKPADGGIMLDADSLAAPIVAATAPVIAAWAREQERERIREAIKARATEREAEMLEADRKASYKDSPGWAGIRDEKAAMSDELQSLLDDEPALTVLDRDGSADTREDGTP